MRFALIAAPRFGTHLLRNALNGHPDIYVSREILNPTVFKHGNRTGVIVLQEWYNAPHPEACVGTLLHRDLYWPPISNEFEVWDEVARTQDKVISVVRDNLLKAYLSRLVAMRQTRDWGCFKVRTKKVTPMHMKAKDLLHFCNKFWGYYGRVDLRYFPRLMVTYEEMCLNWSETMVTIQKFLGAPVIPLPQVTYKQETRSLRDSILNYSEIAKVVGDIGCGRWLD
jgi:hypothetical protein